MQSLFQKAATVICNQLNDMDDVIILPLPKRLKKMLLLDFDIYGTLQNFDSNFNEKTGRRLLRKYFNNEDFTRTERSMLASNNPLLDLILSEKFGNAYIHVIKTSITVNDERTNMCSHCLHHYYKCPTANYSIEHEVIEENHRNDFLKNKEYWCMHCHTTLMINVLRIPDGDECFCDEGPHSVFSCCGICQYSMQVSTYFDTF